MKEPTTVERRAFKKMSARLARSNNPNKYAIFVERLAALYHTTPSGLFRYGRCKNSLHFAPALAMKYDRFDVRDLLPFPVRFGNSRLA
jgi:hypothetical protein